MPIPLIIPNHLPQRLTITMWDFSWYTMTMPGEPYHDLQARFTEAVERGYNTIRICAMPFLLFTSQGPRSGKLRFSNLGQLGQRSRWYNCAGGAELDGHQHILELFKQARLHNCYIILSSWEYQQSPSFLESAELWQELRQIPPAERFLTIAHSMNSLLDFLKQAGFHQQIAYAELHNEIEFGQLTALADEAGIPAHPIGEQIRHLTPYVEEAVKLLRDRHPDILMTGCYTANEPYDKKILPRNFQVAHFHLYLKGVLQQLMDAMDLDEQYAPFPNPFVQSLLRENAPSIQQWQLPPEQAWRLDGNPVGAKMLYVHDWADPDRWDAYLYDHYGEHKQAMLNKAEERLTEIHAWADEQHIPVVVGEGYIGYTPLYASFEEGPVGKFIAEYAIQLSMKMNFWGMTLCSNCAPHHPFWQDIHWQQRWNQYILTS